MDFDELERVLRIRQQGQRRERRLLAGTLAGLLVVGLVITVLVVA